MQPESKNNITQILASIRDGDRGAADRLLPLVYDELREIAARIFKSRQIEDKIIQPTVLAHDVFMKLAQNTDIEWQSRAHFYAVASKAIRELLIDHARRQMAAKRGGNWTQIELTGLDDGESQEKMIDILDLDAALKQLGELSPRQEQIVEMRFYSGMTVEEVARVIGVTSRTVQYDWRMARAWLRARLEGEMGDIETWTDHKTAKPSSDV